MTTIRERLRACAEQGTADPALLAEAAEEIDALCTRQNTLEELLIMVVRTGWPWDEEGEPNDIFRACRDGYTAAMVEARELLGLGHLSMITRTEPRT
jgi:hypothetical protein